MQPTQFLLDHGQEPNAIGDGEFVCGETADVIDRLLRRRRLAHNRGYLHKSCTLTLCVQLLCNSKGRAFA